MKTNRNLLFSLLVLFACCSITVSGQDRTKKTTVQAVNKNKISAEDEKAIREIFKDVDPKEYRLEFNTGKEVAGKKEITMTQLRQINKVRSPLDDKASIVLVVRDDGVMYIFASTKSKLTTLLGREKMAKLNAITAKYQ